MSRRIGPVRTVSRISWDPTRPRRAPRLTLGAFFSVSLGSKTVRRALAANDDHAGYHGPARKSWCNDA